MARPFHLRHRSRRKPNTRLPSFTPTATWPISSPSIRPFQSSIVRHGASRAMTSRGNTLRGTGTPEFELLLESARPPSDADTADSTRPAREIDWTLLLDRAVEKAMIPLVRRHPEALRS